MIQRERVTELLKQWAPDLGIELEMNGEGGQWWYKVLDRFNLLVKELQSAHSEIHVIWYNSGSSGHSRGAVCYSTPKCRSCNGYYGEVMRDGEKYCAKCGGRLE
jgi:hypothetical protein